jgi:hypothetical protein
VRDRQQPRHRSRPRCLVAQRRLKRGREDLRSEVRCGLGIPTRRIR